METDSFKVRSCRAARVLLLADDPEIIGATSAALGTDPATFDRAGSVDEFLTLASESILELVLLDFRLTRDRSEEIVARLQERRPSPGYIWLVPATSEGSELPQSVDATVVTCG